MKKYFYSHIVSLEHVKIELSGLNLTKQEQEELMEISERQLHHVMLNEALSKIKGEDKKLFLHHLAHNEHEKAWDVLCKHTKDAEKHLMHAAHVLYEDLRKDIRGLVEDKSRENDKNT